MVGSRQGSQLPFGERLIFAQCGTESRGDNAMSVSESKASAESWTAFFLMSKGNQPSELASPAGDILI